MRNDNQHTIQHFFVVEQFAKFVEVLMEKLRVQ